MNKRIMKGNFFWVYLTTLFCAIVFFLFLSFSYLRKPMMSEGNTYSRLQTTIMEINSPNRQTDYSWLPFYDKIMTIPLKIYFDPTAFSARVFTMLITMLTAVLVYRLTYLLTKMVTLSLAGASFYLINPLTISLSTLTLSESIWTFFMLGGVVFLLGNNKKYWFLGMIFWIVSQGIRYESWYLTPVLMFVVWMRHKNIKLLFWVFISSLLFPFYWMFESYKHTGAYLNILNIKKYYALSGPTDIYGNLWSSVEVWWERVLQVFTIPIIVLFLSGLYKQVKLRIWLWLIPVTIVIMLILQVFLGTMEYFPARYLVALPILVYPLVMVTINKSIIQNRLFEICIIVLLFIMETANISKKLMLISEQPIWSAVDTGHYISKNIVNEPFVYINEKISDTTWTYSQVWYFSQVPISKFYYGWDEKYTKESNNWDNLNIILEKGDDELVDDTYINLVEKRKVIYQNKNFIIFDRL